MHFGSQYRAGRLGFGGATETRSPTTNGSSGRDTDRSRTTTGCRNTAHRRCAPAVAVHGCVIAGNFIPGFNGSQLPPALLLYNPYAVLNYLLTAACQCGIMHAVHGVPELHWRVYPTPGVPQHRASAAARRSQELLPVCDGRSQVRARRYEPRCQSRLPISEDERGYRRSCGASLGPDGTPWRPDGVWLQPRTLDGHPHDGDQQLTVTSCRRWTSTS